MPFKSLARRAYAVTALSALASVVANAQSGSPTSGSDTGRDAGSGKAPFADEAKKVDAVAEEVKGELKQAGQETKEGAKAAAEKTETVVNDAIDKKSEVIDFDKGSSALSENELSSLRALMASLDAPSKNAKIYVAGWSDQELPADGRKALGNDSVKLANDRIGKVRAALKKLDVKGEVVPVNLAKSPNTLQEVFGTKSAKVSNKALHNANSDDARLDEAGKAIQGRGGPSKVVVYVQQ